MINQVTHIGGVPQRLFGWLLMLVLAELTGKFGSVSTMSAVAALATRAVRRSASLYVWVVGLGYALGGLTFDLLFSLSSRGSLEGKTRKLYMLVSSVVSGAVASATYLVYQFLTLGPEVFAVWFPLYVPSLVIQVTLGALGTLIGLSILPLVRPWSVRVNRVAVAETGEKTVEK